MNLVRSINKHRSMELETIMLSPKLRKDIYELWTMFWSSGMTNPLTSIEQITYLLFLKRLETLDKKRTLEMSEQKRKRSIYGRREHCKLPHHPDDGILVEALPPDIDDTEYCVGHGTCRWSYIVQGQTDPVTPHEHLSQYVFPWLRELEKTLQATGNGNNGLEATAQRMEDAYFQLPREKTATLQRSIKSVDSLFGHVDSSDDVMGDIFEFLLSEIQTSGKNGQFRTPRHIIRFMIELLQPDWNESIADPAAGTGGFLINSIQYVLKRYTDPRTVLLEWDGTPHRIDGAGIPFEEYPPSDVFTGYDNDRTMVRIGWMNLILHGIENPKMLLQDTLGKRFEDASCYDIVLANPPFTGTVDKGDLNARFKDLPTNKSELLFVLLLLNLLKVGGRAAVIVPEGVLFGSTNAHKELRRRLLLDNILNGVVSLPAGVFQPYTGVKTSILLFRKVDERCKAGTPPQTQDVWFYEVAADGYTLDAKRNPKPEPNDLWDAIEKWRHRDIPTTDYYQPQTYTVRWRLVDDKTISLFSSTAPEMGAEKDQIRGNHELFRDLPISPDTATQQIIKQQQPRIRALYERCLTSFETYLRVIPRSQKDTKVRLEEALHGLNGLFDKAKREMLEHDKDLPEYGRKALDPLLLETRRAIEGEITARVERIMQVTDDTLEKRFSGEKASTLSADEIEELYRREVEAIVREFAKMDGYNVQLRTPYVIKTNTLQERKHWIVPVRTFARRDDWISSDGTLQGSHDEQGEVRPRYIADHRIYNTDGTLEKDRLESTCIEYNDFNLSAGRYKPFTATSVHYDPPAQIIRELQDLEQQIQTGLDNLLAMVEGQE